MDPHSWPRCPVPGVEGNAWQRHVDTLADLHGLRAALRAALLAHERVAAVSAEDQPIGPGSAATDTCEVLLLIVDELAANGLRHGSAPVTARIVGTACGWLVDISDHAADHPPQPATDRDPALGGMGLPMVAALSADRGWDVTDDCKHVWACLTATSPTRW